MKLVITCMIVVGGLILVFSESPYFSIFGVLLQAGGYSLYLFFKGLPFFAKILVLIYIGGMMVVFLFSTVLTAESFPKMGGMEVLVFFGGIMGMYPWYFNEWGLVNNEVSFVSLGAEVGLGEIFGVYWLVTCGIAFLLLIGLMVVLVLGLEHGRGSLRNL